MRCHSLPSGTIQRTCTCVSKDTHTHTHLRVPSLSLHTKDKNLISEKSWNRSTVAAEKLNQRRQFHWRKMEEEKEDQDRGRKKSQWWCRRRGVGWGWGAEREISQEAEREGDSIACVWAVIIQQASIMELQQRTEYISLWPGLLTLSYTHTHLNTQARRHHCATSKESSLSVFYVVRL